MFGTHKVQAIEAPSLWRQVQVFWLQDHSITYVNIEVVLIRKKKQNSAAKPYQGEQGDSFYSGPLSWELTHTLQT